MPLYEYRSDDGRTVELAFRMNDEKPEEIARDGVTYRRVYGNCQINDMAHATYPYLSRRLGPRHPAAADCEKATVMMGKGKNRRAVDLPIVKSAAHERELMAKHGLERE